MTNDTKYLSIDKRLKILEEEPVTIVMPALMTAEQVAKKLCVCVRTVWRMLARGELPQPKKFNRKLVRWRTEDIDNYIRAL